MSIARFAALQMALLGVAVVCVAGGDAPALSNGPPARAVLPFRGYRVVLARQETVPVRMHEPQTADAFPVEREADINALGLKEFQSPLRPDANPSGGVPTLIPPPPVPGDDDDRSEDGGRPSLRNLVDGNMSGWGWLADDVFSARRAERGMDRLGRDAGLREAGDGDGLSDLLGDEPRRDLRWTITPQQGRYQQGRRGP